MRLIYFLEDSYKSFRVLETPQSKILTLRTLDLDRVLLTMDRVAHTQNCPAKCIVFDRDGPNICEGNDPLWCIEIGVVRNECVIVDPVLDVGASQPEDGERRRDGDQRRYND